MPAIVFDLDGTLINSIPCIVAAAREACAELHIPWDEQRIISMIGLTLRETGERLLGPGRGEEYYAAYHQSFLKQAYPHMTAFDGVAPLLDKLHKRGVPLGVVTSKVRRGCLHSLEALALRDYFSVLVTASDQCGSKPEPGPALCACRQLGLKPAEVLFVGDSFLDIQCGKRAGTATCAVTWGATSKARLLAEQPQYLAETMDELESALFNWLAQFL